MDENLQLPSLDTLVMGGGGTAGYTYMGALREIFSEQDPTKYRLSKVKNFIGTSAGSIMVTILSCTHDQDYLFNKFGDMNISDLQDNSFGVIRDTIRLYRKFGWNKGDYALNIAYDIMEELTGKREITFEEHYNLTGKNLIITGTNMTTRNVVYFNRLTHPTMHVAKAVRISISLPVIFVPVEHTSEKFSDILGRSNLYVDGGLTSNYPFNFIFTELFDLLQREDDTREVGTEEAAGVGEVNEDNDNNDDEAIDMDVINKLVSDAEIEEALKIMYSPQRDEVIENKQEKINRTIGIKSFSVESMDSIDHSYTDVPDVTFNVKSYISCLVDVMMNATLKGHIDEDIWNRTIKIDISGINTTDFNLSDEDKQNMIQIGADSAVKFLDN